MRVLFAGSPQAAVPTLAALHASENTVAGVITQPPRPYGRKKELRATPVFNYAIEHGIPVATPSSAEGLVQAAGGFTPDIAIVVAFGRIFTEAALEVPPKGWWNVHFSSLPEFRGAAPVAHTILAGESVAGLTLFKIVEELDAGPIAMARTHPVSVHDTAGTLLSKLAAIAPEMVLEFLADTERHPPREQVGTATFAPKFPQGFGELDVSAGLDQVYQHFRAVTPEPGAFVRRADTGGVVKILAAWGDPDYHQVSPGAVVKTSMGILLGTGTMPLVLERVQPEGKKPMAADDWFRGLPQGVTIEPGAA
jgi:methionyl-tRNA formyltransferase